MPTILRFRGFQIMIDTEDHLPIHVHAVNGHEFVVFDLDCAGQKVRLQAARLRRDTVRRLQQFVGDNPDFTL